MSYVLYPRQIPTAWNVLQQIHFLNEYIVFDKENNPGVN